MGPDRLRVRVDSIREEAEGIRSYVLVDPQGRPLPAFSAGAHIDLFLGSGLIRQYSLVGDAAATTLSYQVAVLREDEGRGGSRQLHDTVKAGDVIEISAPRNSFPVHDEAKRHVFIAGGIGITPILSMVRTLDRQGATWRLHYCVRSLRKAAFLDLLAGGSLARHTMLYVDGGDPTKGLDTAKVVSAEKAEGTHLYCCGPPGLLNAVRRAAEGWPAETVHFESFGSPTRCGSADSAFEIEIASTGEIITVQPGETILEALRRNGKYVPSICTQGVCGTCVVDLLDGIAEHRDSVLFENERSRKIATCCSRALSPRLKLGL